MHSLYRAVGALTLLLPMLSHAAGDAGSCHYVPVAKLDLDVGARRGPTLTGSINGKPAPMLLSTGSYESRLMRQATDRLGLSLEGTGKYSYYLSGPAVTYRTRIDDLAVGASHTGRTTVPVIDTHNYKPPFDAIIGADFLLQTDMELSIKDKFVQFFRASGCGDTFLAYWDQNAMEIPFVGKDDKANRPFIPIELNGVRLMAILDTGIMTTVVKRHAAEAAGVSMDGPRARKVGKVAGFGDAKLERWSVDFTTFSIGGETVNNPRMIVTEDSPALQGRADVFLGLDFLRAHRVLFAMSQDRLYLSYLGTPLFGATQQTPEAAPEAH